MFGEKVILSPLRSTVNMVNRPFWGCSSTATSTDNSGSTGLWWSATYIDLLGKGAASSSSSFDHITAPVDNVGNTFYNVCASVHVGTTGELYVQRWPVGSTGATFRQIISTGGDMTINKMYQFTIPVSAGEEWTVGMTAAASTASYSLYINEACGIM
jgi:hypothetical protein